MLLSGFQRNPQKNQDFINGHLNRAESSLTVKQVDKLISDILNHLPLALQADRVVVHQPCEHFLQACGLEESSVNQLVTEKSSKMSCKA